MGDNNLILPAVVPEVGFYYHYKHDPAGPLTHHVYEVIGVGFHTEDDCRPEDMHLVIYRPLYASSVYKAGKFFDLRPLMMFLKPAVKNGVTMPRFRKITNPETIRILIEVRASMYP